MLLTDSIVPTVPVDIKQHHCLNNRVRGCYCQRCEMVCPKQSIKVSTSGREATIGVDDTCFGCGLCAAACPTGAIVITHRLPEQFRLKNNAVELTCRKQQVDGAVACLGLLDAASLSYIGLQFSQVNIVLDSRHCKDCNPGVPDVLRAAVSAANTFLKKFGKPAINILYHRGKGEAVIGRRELLAFCFSRAREAIVAALPFSLACEQSPREGIVEFIARKNESSDTMSLTAAPLFWGARIKESCNFCGICARACKQAALTLAADRESRQITLLHKQSACIGCKVCQMLCPNQCLDLKTELSRMQLVGSRLPAVIHSGHCCSICGGFMPEREPSRCKSCSKEKNLFMQAIY